MPDRERLNPAEVSRCSEWIHARSGLDFPPSRLADLEQVIAAALARTQLPDVHALLELLADDERGAPVLGEMIVGLTVNETYFFRNRPQFYALEHHILPALIEHRRPRRQLRIWSAGCATGEEPYSLAILLEKLLPDIADWNIHLLATDINAEVLAAAKRGCYGEWSFRHVAAEVKESYFAPTSAGLAIHPHLRERVTFARHNLAEDAFPSYLTQTNEMDLILCRNVLIYFRSETVRRIVHQFGQALGEGGWLIVGAAEPSPITFSEFAARNFPGMVAYLKEGKPPQTAPLAPAQAFREATLAPKRAAASVRMAAPRQNAPYVETSALQKAKALADQMQWAEAEHWITAALERDPLLAAGHYLRALILLEQAQPEPALAALRSCVYVDADFVMGHVALADLYERQGQPARARKALETAQRLAARAPAHELIPEGDGLTAGRLLEIVNRRKQQS